MAFIKVLNGAGIHRCAEKTNLIERSLRTGVVQIFKKKRTKFTDLFGNYFFKFRLKKST